MFGRIAKCDKKSAGNGGLREANEALNAKRIN